MVCESSSDRARSVIDWTPRSFSSQSGARCSRRSLTDKACTAFPGSANTPLDDPGLSRRPVPANSSPPAAGELPGSAAGASAAAWHKRPGAPYRQPLLAIRADEAIEQVNAPAGSHRPAADVSLAGRRGIGIPRDARRDLAPGGDLAQLVADDRAPG